MWVALLVVGAGALLLHAVGLSNRSVAAVALIAGGSRSPGGAAASGRCAALLGRLAPRRLRRRAALRGWPPGRVAARARGDRGRAASDRRAVVVAPRARARRRALRQDPERGALGGRRARPRFGSADPRAHPAPCHEPRRVAALARRQERELRGWLYSDRPLGDESASLVAALSGAAAEVEELYGVRVEIASAGDCPVDDAAGALVLAAREAMTNAAKFAGSRRSTSTSRSPDEAVVGVRPRPRQGLRPSEVPARRRGLAESIEGRMERAGGRATVTSAPGEGTEVELRVPREAT